MPKNLWSEEEDDVLRSLYPEGSWEELKERLPGRTRCAITNRAFAIRVTRLRKRVYVWGDGQLERLRKAYPTESRGDIEDLFPGQTWKSIQLAANSSGIRRVVADATNQYSVSRERYFMSKNKGKTIIVEDGA